MRKNQSIMTLMKSFAGDSVLYALMSVSTKLIAFIMFPIYINLLTKTEIGALGVIDSTINILTILVIFGTDSALGYYYFAEKDLARRQQYVQLVMSFRVGVSLFFSILVLLFGDWIIQLLDLPNHFLLALQISLFTLTLDTIGTLVLTVYRFDTKTIRVVSLTVLKMLLIAILSYLFLTQMKQTIDSVMIGRLLSVAVIFLFISKDAFKYFRLKFDKEIIIELFSYAYPLVPASLAFWIINGMNRYLITWLEGESTIGLQQVAMYETAFRFASMITLVTYGIQMAWRPYSMLIREREDCPRILSKIYIVILVIGIIGILFVATFIPWIFDLMKINPQFYESYQYVGVLSFAMFLGFYYLIISTGLFYTKNTKVISRAFVAAAILSVILSVTLYPLLGIWGIVITNLVTYAFANTIVFFYSQKSYYVPVSVRKLVFLLVQTIVALAAIVYIQTASCSSLYLVFPWLYLIASLLICRIDREFRLPKRV